MNSLGTGIDTRGGDASGYVTINRETGTLYNAKRVGPWCGARRKFAKRAAMGDMGIMHARWATCGNKKSQDQAHPFEIKREGETKLFGMHNGCIWNAKKSAKANGREKSYNVDSKELFELMADGDIEGIQELDGYGVITWYVPGSNYINLVRLSKHSDICVVSLKGGGMAWASTWSILSDALDFAELEADLDFQIPDIGRIYQIRDTGVYKTNVEGVLFESKLPDEEAPESWESELIARWEKEQEEEDKQEMYRELMMQATGEDDRDSPPMFDAALRTSWERDEDEQEYPSIAAMYR